VHLFLETVRMTLYLKAQLLLDRGVGDLLSPRAHEWLDGFGLHKSNTVLASGSVKQEMQRPRHQPGVWHKMSGNKGESMAIRCQ
jgi:hypothetical protein